jgi:uncharacterized membrane protein YgcG
VVEVVTVAGGEMFTSSQRQEIDRAIREAETVSRLEFSVFVGRSEGETRPFAERLHATLVAPDRSVLVLVDPVARLLEVVTGRDAHRVLEDAEVRLAVLAMQSTFADGDLVGGITRGVQQLAEHARRPTTRHGG